MYTVSFFLKFCCLSWSLLCWSFASAAMIVLVWKSKLFGCTLDGQQTLEHRLSTICHAVHTSRAHLFTQRNFHMTQFGYTISELLLCGFYIGQSMSSSTCCPAQFGRWINITLQSELLPLKKNPFSAQLFLKRSSSDPRKSARSERPKDTESELYTRRTRGLHLALD